MRLAALLVSAAFLAAAMAGCAKSGAAAGPESKPLPDAKDVQGSASLLRVLVLTDEYLPVPDAKVRIVGLGIDTNTNDAGSAYFQIGQPGRYSVHVNHRSFYPNVTKVEVEPHGDAVLRVTLRDAPRDGFFSDFYYYQGICQPAVYVQAATPGADCPATPFLRQPDPKWIASRGLIHAFFQLDWQPTPTAAKEMRIGIAMPEAGAYTDGKTEQTAEGVSPVRLDIPNPLLNAAMKDGNNALQIRIGLGQSQPVLANLYSSFEFTGQLDYFVAAPDVSVDS